jgi:hypothetical protein
MRRPLLALLAAAVLAGCGDGPGSTNPRPPSTGSDPVEAHPPSTGSDPVEGAATATATATGGPEEQAVADALNRYAAAVRAGDARTICRELLASEVTERVERAGGSCEEDLMAPRIEEGGTDYAIGIASIAVQGDRAVAQITASETDGPRDTRQPLVRERGTWRLAVG